MSMCGGNIHPCSVVTMLTVTEHLTESSVLCLSDSVLIVKAVDFPKVLEVIPLKAKIRMLAAFQGSVFFLTWPW